MMDRADSLSFLSKFRAGGSIAIANKILLQVSLKKENCRIL